MKFFLITVLSFWALGAQAQGDPKWEGKFEQLGQTLPTPNEYRTGSGAPGPNYWQQKADYVISIELHESTNSITGSETITYTNNSPDVLKYLWLQVDQNILSKENTLRNTGTDAVKDSANAKTYAKEVSDFDAGYKIKSVTETNGKPLPYTINNTMMRVDLPQPLRPGQKYSFGLAWSYNIVDRSIFGQRSGMEFFPEDGNYVYTIAQFFPRMCVYDDYEGWQNKQYLGTGEFTLPFGDYKVKMQMERLEKAKSTYDKPVIIVTQAEAVEKEKTKSTEKKTWEFHAENVRDFAFVSSRKFIWDAQTVKLGNKSPLAMSLYSKEGNPLWEKESTKAIKNTLEVYSRYTLDYPYPVAISVHTASIGMEYPMICFNNGRTNKDGSYSESTKYGMIGVITHEVGHNFFPMIINSDERQWTWMDEGLNSYVQHLTQELFDNKYPSRRGPAWSMTDYMTVPNDQLEPIMTNS